MSNPPIFPRVKPISALNPWDSGPQALLRGNVPGASRGVMTPTPGGGGFIPPSGPVGPGRWVVLPHQYADPTTTIISPIDVISVKVLDKPTNFRNYLLIRNPNAVAILFVQFGGAATAQSPIVILPNIMIAFDSVVPQDDMWALSNTAASFISIMYATTDLPAKDY